MEKVLITGGTGLVGQKLCDLLQQSGFEVVILSRTKKSHSRFQHFLWNPDNNEIDRVALNSCDHIIHLAGVNIG